MKQQWQGTIELALMISHCSARSSIAKASSVVSGSNKRL